MSVDELLLVLAARGGGDADVRERERALAALLARPDEAQARAQAALEHGDLPAAPLAQLLAQLGRPESVQVLARLLASPLETVRRAGADALAVHPADAAGDELVRELVGGSAEAADALAARGHPTACTALVEAAAATDATLRYHALRAAAELGCPGVDDLVDRAARDPDADIRALAAALTGS